MYSKFKLYFNTLRYLKPVQIYGRLWFRLYRPRVSTLSSPELRVLKGVWNKPCLKNSSLINSNTARFLNVEHDIYRPDIWNNPAVEKLWLYNLHYFDDLGCEEAVKKNSEHRNLINRWISENLPGVGNGWEPYPISLRIVNWFKWKYAGNDLSADMVQSLAVQTRWLRQRLEYHLLGNHLFANAKALVFSGIVFEGDEAESWLATGLKIIDKELPEQLLADGGNFELSPMYHAIMTEDMLDLVNLSKLSEHPLLLERERNWSLAISRMLEWLKNMTHPDGGVSFFNDSTLGIAPRLTELVAYADRLGIDFDPAVQRMTHLKESGYIRIEEQDFSAILDVGKIGPDYIPGHAHADSLSFELSTFGQRFIVNSGISCYGNSAERLRQRGTAAHSTVMVNDQNSSEVWGGFRVARRAYPEDLNVNITNSSLRVTCQHSGYKRCSPSTIHSRTWEVGHNAIVITDLVSPISNNAKAFFHIHPDWMVKLNGTELEATNKDGQTILVLVDEGDPIIEKSTFHPGFGETRENTVLIVSLVNSKIRVRALNRAHFISIGQLPAGGECSSDASV